ncbi:EAL domain-containing protein [Colwellia sp. RSH04]|uniref:EAL domain-containing protein n=1 Tax=Colwellia sp. RSH04 TaxID=2305464 RepID=UPI0015FAE884|nr:EAL domain-containing protein [Colwellia sp. RSH04]
MRISFLKNCCTRIERLTRLMSQYLLHNSKVRLRCSIALLLSIISSSVLAQSTPTSEQEQNFESIPTGTLKFSHLSSSDGLSSSNVFAINQDKQGYLWIGTEDGLNRYDGQNFKTYRHQITDSNSISANLIRKIFIDSNNTLWVGTQNGLSRYNRELDNFDNFHHQEKNQYSLKDNVIWDIYQDNKFNIWVSTEKGLHTLEDKNNNVSFNRISIVGLNKELTEIKTIYHDKANNNYWFGSFDKGIHILNENVVNTDRIKDSSTYAGSLQSKNKLGLTINADSLFEIQAIDKKLWLATDNGVYIIKVDSNNNYTLTSHITTEHGLLSNHVRAIEQYDNNHVWLATDKGLNVISLITNEITSHQNSSDSFSLSENWLMASFKDKNNTLWLATYGGGLNKYSPLTAKFHHELSIESKNYRVESFAEMPDGTIYISTERHGLFKLKNNEISPITLSIKENIWQIIRIKSHLYLRTELGKLYKFSTKTKSAEEIPIWNKKSKFTINQRLIAINNSAWFINKDKVLTKFNTINYSFQILPHLSNLITLQRDGNNIWLTNESRELIVVNTLDSSSISMKLTIPKGIDVKQISSIAIGKKYIWLGTNSQGVILINKESKQVAIFNENNKLKNNYIASILIDSEDRAWVATNKNISVIFPEKSEVTHFDSDFLLFEPEFIKYSSFKASNNEIFFGSPQGFYHFLPEELLQVKQKISTPVLSNLYIANKEVVIKKVDHTNVPADITLLTKIKTLAELPKAANKAFFLNKHLNSQTSISLNHNHSPIGFEFVSPNAKIPSQLKYQYKLQGLEKGWVQADPRNNIATYTNLAPGKYAFIIEAFDVQNSTSKKSKSINLEILPPWWLTNTAIFIYALLATLAISFIFQQVNNRRLYHLRIQQNEERLKLSLWGSGDEMWDWNISTGKIYRSNIWGMLEFPQDGQRNEFGNAQVADNSSQSDKTKASSFPLTNIHHHDLKRVNHTLDQHFCDRTEHFESTYRVKDKSGQWIWILDRGKIVERDENNAPTRMTGTLKDISKIKQTEERLKLFAKCIENISDAMVIYDKNFQLVDINKAFTKITGQHKEEVIGEPLQFRLYPESFTSNVKKELSEKGCWHNEIESKRENGSTYITDLNLDVIYDENHNISHYVGIFSDITKRKSTEIELRRLANSDTLTGLPNRSLFQANQTKLVNNKDRHALLVFDLDNFKKINDSLGHQIGDAILCKIAERLLNLGRKKDTVYRLGGDEFSILIEKTNDIHTITTIANEVLTTIARPFKVKSQEIVLYSSIGIVLYPDDGLGPHELLKNADTAMYHAKNEGGNRYQFFSDSMNKKAVQRFKVENLIRLGLKEDAFTVFYQPKIAISTGKIAGMEALVRYETPSHGFLSPAEFIPVSEETGQILEIGEVVLRKACFATKQWVDNNLFTGRVAVNLSAVQFSQANLVSMIEDILNESQLPAKYLELEITEGTVMDSPQKAIETMQQLRTMGISLSLDDFGTGYSSLAYLKQFPINTLKIDKAFVDDIEQSEQGRNMVATIVTIAHNLDMQVVAEGVETNSQLDFLSTLGCEQLQGYLYSKPLAEDKFQRYLLSHQITHNSTIFTN